MDFLWQTWMSVSRFMKVTFNYDSAEIRTSCEVVTILVMSKARLRETFEVFVLVLMIPNNLKPSPQWPLLDNLAIVTSWSYSVKWWHRQVLHNFKQNHLLNQTINNCDHHMFWRNPQTNKAPCLLLDSESEESAGGGESKWLFLLMLFNYFLLMVFL